MYVVLMSKLSRKTDYIPQNRFHLGVDSRHTGLASAVSSGDCNPFRWTTSLRLVSQSVKCVKVQFFEKRDFLGKDRRLKFRLLSRF